MSLILEALKRSEAERQLGKAPGLMTPMASGTTSESRAYSHWVVIGLVAMVILAGSVAMWWLSKGVGESTMRPHDPSPPVASAVSGLADSGVQERARDAIGSAETASLTQADGVDSASRVNRIAESVDASPSDSLSRSEASFVSVERESRAIVAIPDEAPMVGSPPETDEAATAALADGDLPQAQSSNHFPAPPRSQADAVVELLPRLVDLPPDTRNGLPPLKLTMHVFAEQPSNRFVLLDGTRRSEGDELSPGVVLRTIRRDGVVVEHDGLRFLVPRP